MFNLSASCFQSDPEGFGFSNSAILTLILIQVQGGKGVEWGAEKGGGKKVVEDGRGGGRGRKKRRNEGSGSGRGIATKSI